MPDNQSYIGFWIDTDIKNNFQKLCIDKNTDITKMLKAYIVRTVKKHSGGQHKTQQTQEEIQEDKINRLKDIEEIGQLQ